MSGTDAHARAVAAAMDLIRRMLIVPDGWTLKDGAILHETFRAAGLSLSPYGVDLVKNPRLAAKRDRFPAYSFANPNRYQIAAIYDVPLGVAEILSLACMGSKAANPAVRALLLERCGIAS